MLEPIAIYLSFGFVVLGPLFLSGIYNGYTNYLNNIRSPLRNIPGTFYTPLTNLNLQYYFFAGEI